MIHDLEEHLSEAADQERNSADDKTDIVQMTVINKQQQQQMSQDNLVPLFSSFPVSSP